MGNSEARVREDLLYAIILNREGTVSNILKKFPASVNIPMMGGVTNPLCRATYLGHRKISALLIASGADINGSSSEGNTPLIWAAHNNNKKMIDLLLVEGADTSLKNKEGWNALDVAICRLNYEAARELRHPTNSNDNTIPMKPREM